MAAMLAPQPLQAAPDRHGRALAAAALAAAALERNLPAAAMVAARAAARAALLALAAPGLRPAPAELETLREMAAWAPWPQATRRGAAREELPAATISAIAQLLGPLPAPWSGPPFGGSDKAGTSPGRSALVL
jgi:DNA invertase Pin-like site-specific DNA recombinase